MSLLGATKILENSWETTNFNKITDLQVWTLLKKNLIAVIFLAIPPNFAKALLKIKISGHLLVIIQAD